MGYFGDHLFAYGGWTDVDPDAPPASPPREPWLRVSVHDSDFAVVRYAPRGGGTGEAFLGTTPCVYFGDPAESAPTDPAREAAGLAAWAGFATQRVLAAGDIEGFLAADEELPFDEDADDEDVFAELKAARFLTTLGLPLPADLPSVAG